MRQTVFSRTFEFRGLLFFSLQKPPFDRLLRAEFLASYTPLSNLKSLSSKGPFPFAFRSKEAQVLPAGLDTWQYRLTLD